MHAIHLVLISLLIGLSACSVEPASYPAQAQGEDVAESSANPEGPIALQPLPENQMKEVIEAYVQGADEQRLELIEGAFHESFQVIARTEGVVRVLDKKTYLSLLGAGKIGGSKRQIRYLDLHVDDFVGTARINLIGETVIFHDHLSLIKEAGEWKIVSNLTYVSPNP